MKFIAKKITFLFLFTILSGVNSFAAIFTSTQTGNWNNASTWAQGAVPSASDDVIIKPSHVVTLNGSAYTHSGDLFIMETGELIVKAGNSSDGLIFNGGEFHVFGSLTIPFPDKDLSITGNAFFWGHPSANIFISDDWKISGNSQVIVEGICVEVDDDFHIDGTNTSLCGGGGVSIGNDSGNNSFNLLNSATLNQVCLQTTVYRGAGGNCTTIVASGSGNREPLAYADNSTTEKDIPKAIDVLNLGTPDSDPNGDDLQIVAVGEGKLNTGTTQEGGTVVLNDNGTPGISSDDFVDYTPPAGFIGTDYFQYVITDQNGAYQSATVEVVVSALLPLELENFSGTEKNCQIHLEWSTSVEINVDFFEVQRSMDGIRFTSMGEEKAAGFSSVYRVYSFTDALPLSENYYRLKIRDLDGTIEYSDIIYQKMGCIRTENNLGVLSLFPNPVMDGEVKLRFNARQQENIPLVVADLYGKKIIAETRLIDAGMNNISIDVNDFPSGTYLISIGQKVEKFVKSPD